MSPAGVGPGATRPGPLDTALFWAFWGTVGLALRAYFRVRVVDRPRLPGAYVLAPNHSSYLDPLLLGSVVPRRISFLMTEVVWRSPLMGWFYRWNRAIPVSIRNSNREALRAARSALQQGRVVGIFPEGGISRDGGLLLGNPGAVSLVLAAEVPIVPVGIIGSHRALPVGRLLPRPCKVTIRFGAPILPADIAALAPDRRGRLQAATRLIMERVAGLTGRGAREAELAAARRGS